MDRGPDHGAALRGFMALALNMANLAPDRRPTAEMLRWHGELAAAARVPAGRPRTNRELAEAGTRIGRAIRAAAPREPAAPRGG